MKRIGPGPGKYLLPTTVGYVDHDATRPRAPLYSMGQRPVVVMMTDGPGAAKYNIENKTRFGGPSDHAYMGHKVHELYTVQPGPAPNKYKLPDLIGINRTRVWKDKSPDFVMGRRLDVVFENRTPGPNKYMLPDIVGINSKNIYNNRPPIYSMRPRLDRRLENVGPGPAKYDPRRPEYGRIEITLKSRHELHSGHVGPGSNKYNLAEYKPGRRKPAYSMGMVLSGVAQPMIVPCDNCY